VSDREIDPARFHSTCLDIIENILIEFLGTWLALCTGNRMLPVRSIPVHPNQYSLARRALEYAFAVSMALLCSYWIVQARW